MKRINISQYLNGINKVLDSTQKTSTKMDPYFKIFRSALNDDEQIEDQDYADTQVSFTSGIQQYQQNLQKLMAMQVPVNLIGIHKNLIAHYREFVAGCEAMQASIDYDKHTVNRMQFDTAENDQEVAMDKVNRNIQKIIRSLHLS